MTMNLCSDRFMSAAARGTAASDVKALPLSVSYNDRLSHALTSALEATLIRPLIFIVSQYARTADWSRATVETVLAVRDPCGLLVDSARGRLLSGTLPAVLCWPRR
jgi:hypothetical protein